MVTVPEAARRVNRNPETIRRWIRSGRLPAHKVGTQHVIQEEDLKAVLEEDEVPLSPGWDTTITGEPMPNWVKLVRRSRESH